jgi:hypothetical protein
MYLDKKICNHDDISNIQITEWAIGERPSVWSQGNLIPAPPFKRRPISGSKELKPDLYGSDLLRVEFMAQDEANGVQLGRMNEEGLPRTPPVPLSVNFRQNLFLSPGCHFQPLLDSQAVLAIEFRLTMWIS